MERVVFTAGAMKLYTPKGAAMGQPRGLFSERVEQISWETDFVAFFGGNSGERTGLQIVVQAKAGDGDAGEEINSLVRLDQIPDARTELGVDLIRSVPIKDSEFYPANSPDYNANGRYGLKLHSRRVEAVGNNASFTQTFIASNWVEGFGPEVLAERLNRFGEPKVWVIDTAPPQTKLALVLFATFQLNTVAELRLAGAELGLPGFPDKVEAMEEGNGDSDTLAAQEAAAGASVRYSLARQHQSLTGFEIRSCSGLQRSGLTPEELLEVIDEDAEHSEIVLTCDKAKDCLAERAYLCDMAACLLRVNGQERACRMQTLVFHDIFLCASTLWPHLQALLQASGGKPLYVREFSGLEPGEARILSRQLCAFLKENYGPEHSAHKKSLARRPRHSPGRGTCFLARRDFFDVAQQCIFQITQDDVPTRPLKRF